MSTLLLNTKFYLPPVRPTSRLVPRLRLTARVNEGLTRPLTLISAPAGFGKTTLISEWRASQTGPGFPLAWLSLDNDDNDPTRFLIYLVAALGTLKAGLGETTLALLHSPQPPPPQAILTSLINDLGDLDQAFALILDDYHVITAQPIHDALTFILDHLSPRSGMHLVPGVVMLAFWGVAVLGWRSSGALRPLLIFGHIGTSLGGGLGLYAVLPKKKKLLGRRLTLFLVGAFLIGFAAVIGQENSQLEGFFFGLLAGSVGMAGRMVQAAMNSDNMRVKSSRSSINGS